MASGTKILIWPRKPDVEPLIAVENQGEFPTLTDQGEKGSRPAPHRKSTRKD